MLIPRIKILIRAPVRWLLRGPMMYFFAKSSREDDVAAGKFSLRSPVDTLSDANLERANRILPWSAYVVDQTGRRFGAAHSPFKRSTAQRIPDPRIIELNRRYPLKHQTVLEVGCFEGIHSAGLAHMGADVVAVDSRIENVIKTATRCALLQLPVRVLCWDLERTPPSDTDISCDVLHHVGVLYHLLDPVAHLSTLLPRVRKAVMLDTHISCAEEARHKYHSGGRDYRVREFGEGGRSDPFSGMNAKARWLLEKDLIDLLGSAGFTSIEISERRAERNGHRILVFAHRS